MGIPAASARVLRPNPSFAFTSSTMKLADYDAPFLLAMFDKLKRFTRGQRARDRQTSISDEALARRLHDLFERDLYLTGVQDVRFAVRAGVVTLSGEVRHHLDRSLLVSLVESVPGVRAVMNELEVASFQA